jgi:hypothetical protein
MKFLTKLIASLGRLTILPFSVERATERSDGA